MHDLGLFRRKGKERKNPRAMNSTSQNGNVVVVVQIMTTAHREPECAPGLDCTLFAYIIFMIVMAAAGLVLCCAWCADSNPLARFSVQSCFLKWWSSPPVSAQTWRNDDRAPCTHARHKHVMKRCTFNPYDHGTCRCDVCHQSIAVNHGFYRCGADSCSRDVCNTCFSNELV